MKTKLLLAAATLTLAACSANAEPARYNVSVSVQANDGELAYLVNFDTEEKIDSTLIDNGVAVFEGDFTTPVLVRVLAEGNRQALFFLENGNIDFNTPVPTGTPLNDAFAEYANQMQQLSNQYHALPADAPQETILDIISRAGTLSKATFDANSDNPLGYYLFLQEAYEMDEDELNEALDQHPGMKEYKRIQKVMNVFERKRATAPGQMFTDFTIEYDGQTHKLSDYVGKGKYTLVDFWASWCGPCRREAEVLKDIYNTTSRDNLDIVGIAVWDEPENTLEAIQQLQLPWMQVINAQTIPTDLYGILGIPCIILFGPDGTIISRDQQGDDLRAAVSQALNDEAAVQ